MSALPDTVTFEPDGIPPELKERRQWVGWRWRQARDEWTKQPINPHTGTLASHADADTWGSFDDAITAVARYHIDGVGYVFAADDPYAGIDLDKCLEPATGVIDEWAADIIDAANSYSEVSPSGTGVKIIVRGELPNGRGRKKPEIEMYDRLRFFTITGQRIDNGVATIADRGDFVTRLYKKHFPDREPAKVTTLPIAQSLTLDDQEVIDRARHARNGAKFNQLFAGSVDGHGSQSEADAALCSMIAFWTGPDHDRIDRIFRQSALYRDKWEREDYRLSTITLACDRVEFYEPSPEDGARIVFDRVFGTDTTDVSDTDSEFPYVVDLADGLKEPRKPDTWIVAGILREQAVQIIVGPPKTYKSFFAQELSIAVGTGTPMFGEFPTGVPRRVLYIQEESARQHLWTRYEGILIGRGMHPESVRGQVFAITNQGVRLDDEKSLLKLIEQGVKALKPDLVIFDPLREMHWQDENKAEVMMPILQTFKELRNRYNLSVAIIHHNNKNPLYTSPGDSIRGSSAIWGAMDGGVFVSTTEQERVMKVQFDLKEGGQVAPFLYSIKDGDSGIQFNVMDIEQAGKQAFNRMEIVGWSREEGGWFSIDAALEHFPRSDKIIRDAVRDLVKTGHLQQRVGAYGKKEYAHLEADNEPTF